MKVWCQKRACKIWQKMEVKWELQHSSYLKRVFGQGFNGNSPFTGLWLQLTLKTTVEIIGKGRISRIEIWNQKTKEGISFVLSDLRSDSAA